MEAEGLTLSQAIRILEAVKPPRSSNAERQARYRARHRNVTGNVTGNVTSLSPVSETKVSPGPSSKTQPSPSIHPPLSVPPPFDRFWAVYPKRVSKGAARKAFPKAEREASIDEIIAGVEAAKVGRKWRDGYIPDPATWLNAQGWLDEIDATPEPIAGRLSMERKAQDDANLGTQMVIDEIRRRKANGRTDGAIVGSLGAALPQIESDAAGASAMVVRLHR